MQEVKHYKYSLKENPGISKTMKEKLPDGSCLVETPVDLNSGATWRWVDGFPKRVAVVKDGGGGQHGVGESSGSHDIIVPRRLISLYKD